MLLPLLTSFAIGTAAAKTDPPQLIKLTNGKTDSILLPDSRFLEGYGTIQGPSRGALSAWSSFSNGTTNYGYASFSGSVPTAMNVPEPQGSTSGCLTASTACPSLDDGYIRTLVNNVYPNFNTSLNVFDTQTGTAQLIRLHSPATPANKCSGYNPEAVNIVWCNFDEVFASGGGAVGSAPFAHNVTGSSYPQISHEIVAWSGGAWTQLTPNDYQIVQTPCNFTLFFDPTVLIATMAGDRGHVAYAMLNYHLDGVGMTQSGGCYLRQHETSVVMYLDGSPLDLYSFPPYTGNSTFNVQSCVISGCFGAFIGYTGNLLLYTTYTGSDVQANRSYWIYDKSDGFKRQITRPDLSVTDGSRLLWTTPDAGNPSLTSTVWVYDPGRSVMASNGTVLHSVYPLGSFGGAQPFGIDGNTVLWLFTNSTGGYLQAYELYDNATSGGRLLPAVNLAGQPMYGAFAAVGSLPIYYDNGLAAWVGGTGNATDPLAIYVYNVNAAEAGQPSLSSLGLGAYGFTSGLAVVASSFSQGWFFINGATASDQVRQVYAVNVAGLPATGGTSTSSSSSTSATSSSTTVQTTTSAASAIPTLTTLVSSVSSLTASTTSGPSTSGGLGAIEELAIGVLAAGTAIALGGYFITKSRKHGKHRGRRDRDGALPVTMTVTGGEEGFQPVPPSSGPSEEEKQAEEKKRQDAREVG